MSLLYTRDEKLILELFKLKGIAPKRRKSRQVTYGDVVWFLLNYYKEKEGKK